MAIAYQYTSSGYFAGESEDYGVLPHNATYIAPPAKEGHIAQFVNGNWILVENHKDKQGYVNGEPYTVKEFGPLPDGWSDTPPEKTLSQTHAAKYAEIIAKADAARAKLMAGFSGLEAQTWATQEAGARAITGSEADVKDDAAELILQNLAATARSVARVEELASIDGVSPDSFADRIIANADTAYTLGNLTLNEQRTHERKLREIMADAELDDAAKIEAINAVEVVYSVLGA